MVNDHEKQPLLRSNEESSRALVTCETAQSFSTEEIRSSYSSVPRVSSGLSKTDDRINLTLITICLCTGACLPSLDISIIFTIMNEIGTEFHSAHLATWLHTSYAMSCLATIPLAGKLSDVFGRKTIMLLLVAMFLTGSVGCGMANSMNQIIISRIIAGFGGGGLQLLSNVIIQDLVPLQQRGQYQSYVSSVQTLGIALGSPIGGFITEMFGWRYCFKLNILPSVGIGYVYLFHFNNYNTSSVTTGWMKKLGTIDFLGASILALGNVAFASAVLFGGNTRPWSDPLILSMLCISVVSFVVFGLHQAYVAHHPLISHTCIANRNVLYSSLGTFFICISNGSIDFTLPQFFMGVLGFGASRSGLWCLMNALAVPIGCYCAGHYIRLKGRFKHWILFSVTTYTVALLCMSRWMVSVVPFALGIGSMSVLGFSYGSSIVAFLVSVTSNIPSDEVASSMSILMLFRSTGFLFGTAITSSIIQGNLKNLLESRINGPSAQKLILFIRTSIRQVHTLSPEVQQLVADVLGQSLEKAYLFMACSCVLALFPVLLLKNIDLKNKA